jgi:hypothetical protein
MDEMRIVRTTTRRVPRSARNVDEFDQMNQTFRDIYPDVPVPKSVWQWINSAQHRLASAGAVRPSG